MSFLNGFKKGAASFYIVAFSTLVLVIIASSFAAIIISEIARTSNDDLSQSAYDSALAGVEDAKLAFYNYQNCMEKGASATEPDEEDALSCGEIMWYMENSDCDTVAKVLGRRIEEDGSVMIRESSINNNMVQAYTCVKLQMLLGDYRSTLSGTSQSKAIRIKLNNVEAARIKKVKLSWFSDANGLSYNYNNYTSGRVQFPKIGAAKPVATPPTISMGLIQTGSSYSIDDFAKTTNGQTNRGTVFFVPANTINEAKNGVENNYNAGYNEDKASNYIPRSALLKSNDKTAKNLPYVVYCPEDLGNEFACSVMVELPEPINGPRNDDTFVFVVTLPYGKPTTDFALEFYCDDDVMCGERTIGDVEIDVGEDVPKEKAYLRGMQIGVDSTGKANDLFRRVEARLEGSDTFSLSSLGPIELLGSGANSLVKDYEVTKEWNFSN